MGDKMKVVQPVEGHFLHGVSTQVQTVPEDTADYLVKTGAFEYGGGKVTEANKEVGAQTVANLAAQAEAPAAPTVESAEAEEPAEAEEAAPAEGAESEE